MAEARETRVFYKAISDFANLNKDLRKLRSEIAKTQAAEKAFNAASAKDRAAATKASATRAASLAKESAQIKLINRLLAVYRDRQNSVTKSVIAANVAIKAQNNSLLTNTKRLTAAALAAREYAKAQRSITKATGISSDAIRTQKELNKAQAAGVKTTNDNVSALRDHADATVTAEKANVKFVESVGEVNEATGEVIESHKQVAQAVREGASTVDNAARSMTAARRRELDALGAVRVAELNLSEMRKKYGPHSIQVVRAEERLAAAYRRLHAAQELVASDGRNLPPILYHVERAADRVHRSFERIGNFRPRLVPPFIALIPIIGAVVAALNPLVALLGAVGGAAIGLAGQIGSLAGAFLALPGILSAVAAGIGGVIASMGGVGNVFKTYSAMQKAVGKGTGGSGQTQEERAEALADAEWKLAKAQRNVQKAQENLNKARQQALQDLIDLRIEVSRASLNEERAIANLRLAQERYWNVMAEPGSTLGDKLDAAARIKEAEADLQDVRKRNIENQKALTEAEKKGVDQSEKVLDAQENLKDAMIAQRDAQKALKTEAAGGSAAVTAINEYNKALAELSPSARRFVLAIIALEDQWKSARRELQETFFSRWADDLDRLPQAIRNLVNFLKPAVGVMGDFAGIFLRLFTSDEWNRDIATIGEQNGRVLEAMGRGAVALAEALKDVVIAAGPFTEWLVNGIADGAENFRDIVDSARETGRLSSWLDKVADRLERWWTVVKNIGKTIFNYSAAASNFGDWMTDGLIEMTENWRKSSEEARESGSKFQQWLEKIKPVLQEVDRLLGSFFGWFAREANEQGNIDSVVNILRILTDEVGPALGRLFDTLADTDIDEKFLTALASIIESIDTLLESGGSAAFESFFTVIDDFFAGLADFFSKIPEPILQGLLSLFGFLAATIFIGKFTGITKLMGLLLGFNTTRIAGLTGMFAGISALDKLKFVGLLGVIGGLLALAGSSFAKQQDFNEKTLSWLGNPTDENAAEAGKAAQKNGAFFKGLGNIPGTNISAMPGGAPSLGQSLGALTEFLHFWDDLWGNQTSFGTNFEQWLENNMRVFGTFILEITGGFKNLGPTIQREFGNFQRDFGRGWDGFWGNIRTAFDGIVKGLGEIWARIQHAFVTPVNWVITNVYNNGLRSFWNDTAGKLGLAKLPAAATIPIPKTSFNSGGGGGRANLKAKDGAVLPGWSPGRDIHTFYSPTGGTLELSGGEAVMRPEFTRALGKKRIDEINRAARLGKFASGGILGDWDRAPVRSSVSTPTNAKKQATAPPRSNSGSYGGDLFGQVGQSLGRIFSDPVGFVGDGLKAIVNPLLSGMSGVGWSGVVKAIPGRIIDGMVNTVKSWFAANPNRPGSPANAIGWQKQWSAVRSAFPWANLNSAYRPGARTVNGGLSYHGLGRAIDVTPSMAIFNWIRSNYPNSRELIYSPAGSRQIRNGMNYFWGEPVRSQHWDHVHWAMKQGGIWPGVYDNGGWLPHGGAAINQSGKPEAVLTNEESRALKALLGGSGLSSNNMLGAAPASVLGMAPRPVDNSVNIQTLVINNPVPEKPSDSLPKAIRKVGYMNLARERAAS